MTGTGSVPRERGRRAGAALAVVTAGAVLAGCGGAGPATSGAARSGSSQPSAARSGHGAGDRALATRVCDGARQAAARALGAPLSSRIVSPGAADLKCQLTGDRLRVAIESQAGPRAYAEFDTETSHQSQVFGNGGAHDPAQAPVEISVPGTQVAVWIPAQRMVVATDSVPDNGGGGAYVTVTVTGTAASAKTALSVARAAAAATFAAKPDAGG